MIFNGILTNIEDNVSFLKQVMFSEEAHFILLDMSIGTIS